MSNNLFFHIGLSCNKTSIIEAFYTKYFSFERVKAFISGNNEVIILKSEGVYLELFQATESSPLPLPQRAGYRFPGWRHISFHVDCIESKLKEMGNDIHITLATMQVDNFSKGMKACWVSDPEGNIIELCEGYME